MKATVTTSTKQVNVTSVNNDVLIHPRSTDVIVSVPSAVGEFIEKDFQSIIIPFSVAAGQQGEFILDVGKQFFFLGYTATVGNIRVRGYVDEDYRDYDAARPINQDPLMNGGVLFELVTQPGTYRFSMPVTCYSETVMPILVESTSGSAINTTITFFVY